MKLAPGAEPDNPRSFASSKVIGSAKLAQVFLTVSFEQDDFVVGIAKITAALFIDLGHLDCIDIFLDSHWILLFV